MIRTSPTYPSLSRPQLFLGGEYKLVVFNLAVCGVMVLMLRVYFWPLITLIVHVLLVQMAKRDAELRKIYLGYAKQSNRYEPWTASDPREGLRPLVISRDGELL